MLEVLYLKVCASQVHRNAGIMGIQSPSLFEIRYCLFRLAEFQVLNAEEQCGNEQLWLQPVCLVKTINRTCDIPGLMLHQSQIRPQLRRLRLNLQGGIVGRDGSLRITRILCLRSALELLLKRSRGL